MRSRRSSAPRVRPSRPLAGPLAASVLTLFAACAVAAQGADDAIATTAGASDFVARLNDGSTIRLGLADEAVTITTRYGPLRVPVADVQHIEFALRLSDDTRQQIDKALADLDSSQEESRSRAAAQLVALGPQACPALRKAAQNEQSRSGQEAARLLDEIEEKIGEKAAAPRDTDLVQTLNSTIVGEIAGGTLRVQTAQFGELSLRIADARSLRLRSLPEEEPDEDPGEVLPAPNSLAAYQAEVGKSFKFRVTGSTAGTIWGTDVYTTDSPLATAAVHAGALRVGKTGVVRVRIVAPPPSFGGSQRNGVNSHHYGAWPAAFQVLKPKK